MTRRARRWWPYACVLGLLMIGHARAEEPSPTDRTNQATEPADATVGESTGTSSRVRKRLIRLDPSADQAPKSTQDAAPETQPPGEPEPPIEPAPQELPPAPKPLLALFLSLLAVGVTLFLVERVRAWVTGNVALRRFAGALVLVLRLVGFGLVLAIALRLLPEGQDWILWGLVILAIVVGWSVRDLFADVVAGAILAFERRVKKGMWVSGDGFQGTVEGRSLRATWLRDGQGHRLTVPNRAMVGAPMVYDAGAEAEHEVVVRLEGYHDASRIRLALNDAILSSPWVLAGATPVVLRDPADPVVWRVRSKLLEPRFSVHFEGELLERVEDLLRHDPLPGPTERPETAREDRA